MKELSAIKRWIAGVFRPNDFHDTTPLERTLTREEKDALWNQARVAVKPSVIAPPAAPQTLPQTQATSDQIDNEVKWLISLGKRAKHDAKPRSLSKYPMLTFEMIDSGGKPITASQAVKLFKDFMVTVGYLDKKEVDEHAAYFADEMENEASNLVDEIEYQNICSGDQIRVMDALKAFKKDKRNFLVSYVNLQTGATAS